MSGIYLHIPFCRQRCFYCDFYSTTQIKRKPALVKAINKELELRKEWLKGEPISTVYFGGGTPSLLSTDDIQLIFETINKHYKLTDNPEVTFEANPDDLLPKHIEKLKSTPINRLSIGVQSFHNNDLLTMNRRHNAEESKSAVKACQDAGFDNISIDLIYGLPLSTQSLWEKNLLQVEKLNVQHLSAYHLTYEPKTVFDVKLKNGELLPVGEEQSLMQFKSLINWAKANDFHHYEISNFGKEGKYSQHNTSYWMQQKYLGVGPSAHSYNIETRTWNVANLSAYIEDIEQGSLPYELEKLSLNDKHNEFLITGLRTRWGVNLKEFELQFGLENKKELLEKAKQYISAKSLYIKNNSLILSDEGIFICDAILAELMKVDDE